MAPFNLIFFPLAALPSSFAQSHTSVCSFALSNGRLASEKNLGVKPSFAINIVLDAEAPLQLLPLKNVPFFSCGKCCA